jgi:hypothetical protein
MFIYFYIYRISNTADSNTFQFLWQGDITCNLWKEVRDSIEMEIEDHYH